MKNLTEQELNLLEALMKKEAAAKKAGKKLELKNRVQLAVLKRNLKKQMEEGVWDVAGGGTLPAKQSFPNEDTSEGGFDTDAIGNSEATVNMKQTTMVDPKYANGKFESSNRAKINAIKEKIAKLKKMAEDEFGGQEGGLDDPATVGDLVDALQRAADQLAGTAVEDEVGDEDLDQVLESVRQKVLARREKLANLRKSMNEEHPNGLGGDTAVLDDMPKDGITKGWLNVADEIAKDGDTISKTEAVKKVAAFKRKSEAEVKPFKVKGAQPGSGAIWGKEAGDGHTVKHDNDGLPKDGSTLTKAGSFPGNTGGAKKGLTEKLDFDQLLKRGILG